MKMSRRAVFVALCAGASVAASFSLQPRRRGVTVRDVVKLDSQVPTAFGEWSLDRSIIPILPAPDVQNALDKIYDQVLARTYISESRQRVMLSIAYGADQASDATAVHRPEYCYGAQGFSVKTIGETVLEMDGMRVPQRRLLASLGGRVEPISYWVTLNQKAVLPGFGRRLEQIKLGLLGDVPDGMLVRVSSIGPDLQAGFNTQAAFLQALARAIDPSVRAKYFGSHSTNVG